MGQKKPTQIPDLDTWFASLLASLGCECFTEPRRVQTASWQLRWRIRLVTPSNWLLSVGCDKTEETLTSWGYRSDPALLISTSFLRNTEDAAALNNLSVRRRGVELTRLVEIRCFKQRALWIILGR
jgi:hypothetical protein